MSFARFAAITVAVSLLWSTIAGATGPVRPFKHGFWSGGAYTDDRTGAFTHCSAGVAYDSGVNLFVLVTGEYRWWLGFINPKWSFTPNAREPIRLLLDNATAFNRLATIPSGQLLLVPLPDSSRLIDAFRRGSELALEAEGKSFVFRLNDTPAVMDRLTNCVQTSLALKEKTLPPVSQSAAASSSAAAPALEPKVGPVEPRQSAAPGPSGPASANASRPSAASSTAAGGASEARPAVAADGSRSSVAGEPQLAPAEKAAASSASPGKSVTAAADSPSSLAAEDATPSSRERRAGGTPCPAIGWRGANIDADAAACAERAGNASGSNDSPSQCGRRAKPVGGALGSFKQLFRSNARGDQRSECGPAYRGESLGLPAARFHRRAVRCSAANSIPT